MTPTSVLSDEHRVIEVVLDCLEQMSSQARGNGRLDGQSAREALDFFRVFADRCHHGKEEKLLFPALTAKGMPREQGPVGVMLHEHEMGRKLISGMAAQVDSASAGDRTALETFAQHAASYVELLRAHIQKEDHVLFPMAGRILSEAEQHDLLAAYDTVEQDHIGVGVHEDYLDLAGRLAEKFGVDRTPLDKPTGCCCHH